MSNLVIIKEPEEPKGFSFHSVFMERASSNLKLGG